MSEVSTNTDQSIKDNWFKSYWRPAMAWLYFVTCLFDFLLAPILNNLYFVIYKVGQFQNWDPLTLKGAGLYHISMMAIVGITAWSRGQEKMRIMSETSYRDGKSTRSYFQTGEDNRDNYYRRSYDDYPRGGPFK